MATHCFTTCDICGKQSTDMTEIVPKTIPVRFLTEETEGRMVAPYLALHKVDICKTCVGRIVRFLPLEGSGAQGHNKYEFVGSAKETSDAQ